MKHVLRLRWLLIGVWIVGAILLTVLSPNLQQLVAEKGQITVPDNYQSKEANELLQKMNDNDGPIHDLVLVFHRETALSEQDKEKVSSVIEELERQKDLLEISSVLDFSESEEIAESTVSEDETTILVPIEATTENQSIAELRVEIEQITDKVDVPHALTGESLIEEDIVINSEEGLTKTIYITVVLILVILFAVFRSFIAPIIPLITVGISYVIAEGIVAILANTINFPLSTFTQIFMVAIMFGIGTDYCILIISRFKEEMHSHETITDAVIATYKSSGKTVFYAALAVLIGFSTIGLSQFTLYQSAVAVAVGVLIVTAALVTIVPFFLVLLGRKLFWPFDKNVEHKESKLWGALGHFTWTRSIFSLAIIILITLPALLLYKNEQSYDSLAELSDSYDTVKAFNWIEKGFGPGEIMPITVVMQLDEKVDDANDFQAIETITAEIASLEEVAKVRSATRPAGDIIEDFLLEEQTDLLTDGFEDILDGVNELRDGLNEAADEMKEQAPELDTAKDGVQELMDGTNEVRDGIVQIQSALREIEDGLHQGTTGLDEAIDGLETIRSNLQQTVAGHREILGGYKQITAGIQQAEKEMQEAANIDFDFDIESMKGALDGLEESVKGMHEITKSVSDEIPDFLDIPKIPDIPEYKEAYNGAMDIINGLKSGLAEAAEQLGELKNIDGSFNQILNPLNELNSGYEEIINGQEQLAAGLDELIDGLRQLQSGLGEAASGQGEIADNMSPMADGLGEIRDGQGEIKGAFAELQDGLDELADGLGPGADSLDELYNGLDEINRFINEMDFSNQPEVVVIPDEALEEADFWEAADMYLSPDRTVTKFEAVLNIHPYSKEAMQLVDTIEERVNSASDNTNLQTDTFKIGGIPSMNNDLNTVSAEDYKRTATLMLIGIFLILVILLRSLIMPIYLLLSLLLTYYTALGITEFIFVKLVGYDGLTWAIPFFSFVMLIALGVDYSIFLMSRFDEYRGLILYDGMMRTMRNMGTVIISATVILGGTFAAMLPSGVLSLLQIATTVIIGLALYALVILPLLTPICVKLLGEYNWWPFMSKKQGDE